MENMTGAPHPVIFLVVGEAGENYREQIAPVDYPHGKPLIEPLMQERILLCSN